MNPFELELGAWVNCPRCLGSLSVMIRLVPIQVPCSVHGFHQNMMPQIVESDKALAMNWAKHHTSASFLILPYRIDFAERNKSWTLL